ncbi:hypothetical protein IAT38_006408 [Cryptococcus sp. DSM 104549]
MALFAPAETSHSSSTTSQPKALVVGAQHLVQLNGHPARLASLLDIRVTKAGTCEAYVTFVGQDKRLDAWVPESEIGELVSGPPADAGRAVKKFRSILPPDMPDQPSTPGESSRRFPEPSPSVESTPEREHATMTRVRNFEDVRFGEYLIKTWYYSPYPASTGENASGLHDAASRKRKAQETNGHAPVSTIVPPNQQSSAQGDGCYPSRSQMTRTVSDMYSGGIGKGGEGARGRLWACDLCFKYMRTRTAWDRHTSSCSMLQPPGRRVYQRGSYTIWEVDGANATLYCQNLSLFGKLFIDHKSIFFHVENFLFYVICDAATSRRDQVMAFFSKEKLSYDDYNLACIVAFPPFQNRGFGKLLIEFSYYLTKDPSTRSPSLSPGTPERPLSDLGLKGYTTYWVSVILRFLRGLVGTGQPAGSAANESPRKRKLAPSPVKPSTGGRSLRVRKETGPKGEKVEVEGIDVIKTPVTGQKGEYSFTLSLADIAKACHLRIDDTAFTLSELGFLQNRRAITIPVLSRKKTTRDGHVHGEQIATAASHDGEEVEGEIDNEEELGEWKDVEVVIAREMVDEAWAKWRVREHGMLDEAYVLL